MAFGGSGFGSTKTASKQPASASKVPVQAYTPPPGNGNPTGGTAPPPPPIGGQMLPGTNPANPTGVTQPPPTSPTSPGVQQLLDILFGGTNPNPGQSLGGDKANMPQAGAVDPIQAIFDWFTTFYGPQAVGIQNGIDDLEARKAMLTGAFGQQADSASRGSALSQQQIANLLGLNGQMQGFNGVMGGLLGQMRGWGAKGYDNTLADIKFREDIAHKDLKSDATARGAVFTPGHYRGQSDITGLARLTREGTRINFGREKVGYDREAVGLAKEQAQLETQAKNYGLDAQQLQNSLQATLATLNLDQIMTTKQIIDAINSGESQKAALAIAILEQAVANAPYLNSVNR